MSKIALPKYVLQFFSLIFDGLGGVGSDGCAFLAPALKSQIMDLKSYICFGSAYSI